MYQVTNATKIAKRKKSHYQANRERLAVEMRERYERNIEKRAEYHRRYRKLNRAKIYWRERLRRLRLGRRDDIEVRAAPAWLTDDHWKAVGDFYEERDRRSAELAVEHQVDHIVPLQGQNFCGLHVPWNLQVLTAFENRSKRNRYKGPDAWPAEVIAQLDERWDDDPIPYAWDRKFAA